MFNIQKNIFEKKITKKNSIPILFFLSWLFFIQFFTNSCLASTLTIGGDLTSNAYYYTEQDKFQAFENALKLDFDWTGEDYLSGRFITRGSYELLQNDFNLSLIEGYLDFYTEDTDWRIGKQLIFWGSTDGYSPTDNINPYNYYILSQELEDKREAVFAIRGDIYFDKGKLQLVYSPQIALDLYPGFKVSLPDLTVENGWQDSTIAIKYNWTKAQTDYALSLFHGWSTVMNPVPALTLHANRMTAIGFDFSTFVGQTIINGEFAYKFHQKVNANFELSLEASYSPEENLNIAAMIFRKEPGLPFISPQTTKIDTSWGVGGRVEWVPKDYHTIESLVTYNLENKDYMFNISYTWDYSDHLNIKAFYTTFTGKEGDFVMMDDQDRIGIGLKYFF